MAHSINSTENGKHNSPSLPFSPSQIAKLVPSAYLTAHLVPRSGKSSPPRRPSGRTNVTFRQPSLKTSSLTHSNGSAVVRNGDTAVVCGVRAEILTTSSIAGYRVRSTTSKPQPEVETEANGSDSRLEDHGHDELQDLSLLVPNLELSTGCSPAHIPGSPPSTLAQSLSERILSLLHTSRIIDPSDLRIWHIPPADPESPNEPSGAEIKAFWTLYIDILFISLSGNPFDAAWMAVLAALHDTRLPRAWWDADRETILCSSIASEEKRLSLRGMPVASTFAIFQPEKHLRGRDGVDENYVLADPDGFEEGLCKETITISVDKGTKLVKIEKSGGGFIGKQNMEPLVKASLKRWEEVKALVE